MFLSSVLQWDVSIKPFNLLYYIFSLLMSMMPLELQMLIFVSLTEIFLNEVDCL